MESLAKWLHLETFSDPEIEELARKCWRFARSLTDGQPPSWLALIGKSGTGKTHCAQRLWETLHGRLRWDHAQYVEQIIYWPKFIEELRESVREGVGIGRLLDIGRWPLVVLDDIEAAYDPSGFASKNLNMLLGMRVGKWTIITSNLDLAGLSKIDDRIASRLVREPGNLVIEMTTKDYGVRKQIITLPLV
jgi:DNA replication protein DnaC